ncbi:transmembrane protein 143-like isoform X2 [Mya arenaria]|uniref:transmembrane protein 143-like isoform X2 n=1 Tax=Mya arenaria TaxID=6604 RepID=UPI0022E6774C|nr:transmembrane protein 143-like isoform X2 [Mya arenaria]
MANLVRRAGEVSHKIKAVAKDKVIPTSKTIYAKVKPKVVSTSKYVAKELGPPLRRTSKYLLSAARPHVQRTTSAVSTKLQPHVDAARASLQRTLASVAPGLAASQNKDALPEGQPQGESDYRERFIPLTRKSVIFQLMQKDKFLTAEEKKSYENFALALDSAIRNKYHGVLQDLKALFDPLNPDTDTVETRSWNPRERSENEFWLLERLDDVMERANFHEIPTAVMEQALREHDVSHAVKVTIDTSKYDVLKFWALGKEQIPDRLPWYKSWFTKPQDLPKPKLYYKRLVVALRFKRDQKLTLKCFKEIPVNRLEMVLPDGKIDYSKKAQGLVATSVALAGTGVIAKIVTTLADIQVDWPVIFTGVTGLMGAYGVYEYQSQRNNYLADLSRLLYFKTIANNRGLLSLLVDRAEDETLKEALLVYSFLLAKRSAITYDQRSIEMSPEELGGMTPIQLEGRIEKWIRETSHVDVEVDCREAMELLKGFGILTDIDNRLYVLPLHAALRNLPQQLPSVIARASSASGDIAEGYDRDTFAETEDQYTREDKLQRRIGWF